ncbi:MAG: hypothetical protein ACREDF_05170 [Thermoplasmata archaeon]
MAVAEGVDSDHDGVSDGLEDATERTVAASSSGDEFYVSSRLAHGSLQDQFELSYQAGTFEVRYGQEGGPNSSFELEMRNLVEWQDENGNGKIDDGEPLAYTALGSSAFGDVPVQRSNRSDADGGRVIEFRVPSRSGSITLIVTIAQRFMRLGDAVLTPMEAKMEIRMHSMLSYPGSSVGLEVQMKTDEQVLFEDRSWDEVKGFAPPEGTVNVTRTEEEGSASVFFSWEKTALAQGGAVPVALTNPSLPSSTYDLYFAYPLVAAQASAGVVHRTAFGVRSVVYDAVESLTPEIRGEPALFFASLSAVGVLVGLTIVIANRRRKRGD